MSVLNLDTGERIPLSVAEEKLPACINPLSLQIMRMTSEYIRYGSDVTASMTSMCEWCDAAVNAVMVNGLWYAPFQPVRWLG